MTHPNAKPGSTEPELLAVHDSSVNSPTAYAIVAPPTVNVLVTADAPGAANDDTAATQNTIRNPLWIIVMGLACVFGVMAAVMAVG
jgi:hypothetical protein